MDTQDDGLNEADRHTASRLIDAFAGVVYNHSSPATNADADADTAARLALAFSSVVLPPRGAESTSAITPDDGVVAPVALLRQRPRRRPLRWASWLAAAAVASVVAGAMLLGPTGSSTAWAAEPRTPSSSERAGIDDACGAPLARGLGAVEWSHVDAVGGSAQPGDVRPGNDMEVAGPTDLPRLAALDLRGDIAFAIYQDSTWTVSCVVRSTADGWRDQGIQVGPGSVGLMPGVIAGSATVLTDGETITTLNGALAPGTTRVTFRLDDGTEVEASVVGDSWAAWIPGVGRFDPTSLKAYDADGNPVGDASGA